MKTVLSSFFIGILFALGLGLSGMTQPQNVISFLDIFGQWDGALAFVMIGAISTHFYLLKVILNQKKPLLADRFHNPQKTQIDKKMVMGASLFGIGWGLVGYCPAPAVVALATGTLQPLLFVISMVIGMMTYQFIVKRYIS